MNEQEEQELGKKALAVIEGSLSIDEPRGKRLGFIYRMAHVGMGTCEHKDWAEEMEGCYQQLLNHNIISPIAPISQPQLVKLRRLTPKEMANIYLTGAKPTYIDKNGYSDWQYEMTFCEAQLNQVKTDNPDKEFEVIA